MEYWFITPTAALLFGILALAPLGSQVLARGVVFIDLAVAQAAAAAALGATAWLDHPDFLAVQLAAAAGALSCAALVAVLARTWPQQREALIGLAYVAGACLAMLAARNDPHGREHLSELLAADVLWADWAQVGTLATCAIIVILLQFRWPTLLTKDRIFFPCFALVASMAVPILGLLLVFACLIGPGLWLRAGLSLAQSLVAALGAAGLGLIASWWLDAPSGACVALALAVWGVFSALLRQRLLKRKPGANRFGSERLS